jgi:hypothetical protein
MGFLDSLRKFFEPAKPPIMEQRRIQYEWGVMRLPESWQFTHADFRAFGAQGPSGCSVVIMIRPVVGAVDTEKQRKSFALTMTGMVKDPSARITDMPGVGIWVEAAPTAGTHAVLRIAIFRLGARAQGASRPPLLDVALSMPMSRDNTPRDGEASDQLRSALRAIEWS